MWTICICYRFPAPRLCLCHFELTHLTFQSQWRPCGDARTDLILTQFVSPSLECSTPSTQRHTIISSPHPLASCAFVPASSPHLIIITTAAMCAFLLYSLHLLYPFACLSSALVPTAADTKSLLKRKLSTRAHSSKSRSLNVFLFGRELLSPALATSRARSLPQALPTVCPCYLSPGANGSFLFFKTTVCCCSVSYVGF